MTGTRKRGRPAKTPQEKMFFGIKCTDREKDLVWGQIRDEERRLKRRVTVADFFLEKIGLR